jgi:hypothetical protein
MLAAGYSQTLTDLVLECLYEVPRNRPRLRLLHERVCRGYRDAREANRLIQRQGFVVVREATERWDRFIDRRVRPIWQGGLRGVRRAPRRESEQDLDYDPNTRLFSQGERVGARNLDPGRKEKKVESEEALSLRSSQLTSTGSDLSIQTWGSDSRSDSTDSSGSSGDPDDGHYQYRSISSYSSVTDSEEYLSVVPEVGDEDAGDAGDDDDGMEHPHTQVSFDVGETYHDDYSGEGNEVDEEDEGDDDDEMENSDTPKSSDVEEAYYGKNVARANDTDGEEDMEDSDTPSSSDIEETDLGENQGEGNEVAKRADPDGVEVDMNDPEAGEMLWDIDDALVAAEAEEREISDEEEDSDSSDELNHPKGAR